MTMKKAENIRTDFEEFRIFCFFLKFFSFSLLTKIRPNIFGFFSMQWSSCRRFQAKKEQYNPSSMIPLQLLVVKSKSAGEEKRTLYYSRPLTTRRTASNVSLLITTTRLLGTAVSKTRIRARSFYTYNPGVGINILTSLQYIADHFYNIYIAI